MGEPISVSVGQKEYRRLHDTGVGVDIFEVNVFSGTTDDLWNFDIRTFSDSDNGGILTAIIDSDLNLHERDSDHRVTLTWLIDEAWRVIQELKEIHIALDSEEHWRKAADSDLYNLFYQPTETITLGNGINTYNLASTVFNENTRWKFNSYIESNGKRYSGLENDDFEIRHNGTNWVIVVDGVNEVSFIEIIVSGTATATTTVQVPWDDSEELSINVTAGEAALDVAVKISSALYDKNLENTVDAGLISVSYRALGRINPTHPITINGLTFTYFENAVPSPLYYYNDGDTIIIEKPKEAPPSGTYSKGKP